MERRAREEKRKEAETKKQKSRAQIGESNSHVSPFIPNHLRALIAGEAALKKLPHANPPPSLPPPLRRIEREIEIENRPRAEGTALLRVSRALLSLSHNKLLQRGYREDYCSFDFTLHLICVSTNG